MSRDRLHLYRLDQDYVRELARRDSRVMSIDASQGKARRPFVGIVIPHGRSWYCIPLSSPKPKHKNMKADRDFSKIVDKSGRIIGVLNFNNMIPVNAQLIEKIELRACEEDTPSDRAYKHLLRDQLDWCNANRDLIKRKAAKLYEIVVEHPESACGLVRRCCAFRSLETALLEWERRDN